MREWEEAMKNSKYTRSNNQPYAVSRAEHTATRNATKCVGVRSEGSEVSHTFLALVPLHGAQKLRLHRQHRVVQRLVNGGG